VKVLQAAPAAYPYRSAAEGGVTDWQRNRQVLFQETEPFVRGLLAKTAGEGGTLAAIGYTFEFGTGQLCFDMCANTARNAKESLARHLAAWPDASADEFRWNSGDYDYPGAVQDHFGGWSQAWWAELSRLDRLAAQGKQSKVVHQNVADVCCEVLADLARRGVLGDWSAIDFNVAALLEDVAEVKKRDRRIRKLIGPSADPDVAPDRGGSKPKRGPKSPRRRGG
jgi:hypothetical protein